MQFIDNVLFWRIFHMRGSAVDRLWYSHANELTDQAERMQTHETTVNLCLGPSVYSCLHRVPPLRVQNVPFYIGTTQDWSRDFTRCRQISAYPCVHFKSHLYWVPMLCCKRQHLAYNLHNPRTGSLLRRLIIFTRASYRVTFSQRDETSDVKISKISYDEQRDRPVNT